MADRVSLTVLLCEDDVQERLVRSYLKECGLNTHPPYLIPRNASREVHGGNVGWVLREFPKELEACRQRHATRANTLLIVVIDADDFAVKDRRSHLQSDVQLAGNDPVAVLDPKRHVETWIRAALGHLVNEVDDYKNPQPKKAEVRTAAKQIYGWVRDKLPAKPMGIPSLIDAMPEWRKIG